ncbi:MAG: MBL fold metallo-hydrolase [Gammaproteobacteria bacterium]|jgi:metallo-beta-lactamase family protein
MRLTFLGATRTVTGSKYLIEVDNLKILVDCGLFQGLKELRLRNWAPLPIDPKTIDYVILTHAHIDHSGYLPLLVKNGFKGKILCSAATNDLCRILLPDSGRLHEEDARFANKKGFSKHKPALPLYTENDAKNVFKYLEIIDWDKEYTLATDLNIQLTPVGHILGANYITIKYNHKSLVFSGDVGRFDDPIIKAPAAIKHADYLVVESTYGDRLHSDVDPEKLLTEIINETSKRGGVVIIPAFAVGRSQLIMYYLYQLKQAELIPNIPIYLDSPMATNVSQLYCDYSNLHKLSKDSINAICNSIEYVKSPEESMEIDKYSFPKIIISASGMATGGRVLHHLKRFIEYEKNSVVFTSFQAAGTRGARLLNGEKSIKIHGRFIPVKAQIANIDNLSAHADYEDILHWLKGIENTPKRIFITHGELHASLSAKEKIENKFDWKCIVPEYGYTIEL